MKNIKEVFKYLSYNVARILLRKLGNAGKGNAIVGNYTINLDLSNKCITDSSIFFKEDVYITQINAKWRQVEGCKTIKQIEKSEVVGSFEQIYISWDDWFSMRIALNEAEQYITQLRKGLGMPVSSVKLP